MPTYCEECGEFDCECDLSEPVVESVEGRVQVIVTDLVRKPIGQPLKNMTAREQFLAEFDAEDNKTAHLIIVSHDPYTAKILLDAIAKMAGK